jgi:hypothetical protein
MSAAVFVLRQLGEIDFDGMEGRERINGAILEGDIAAVRAIGGLFGEQVCLVSADSLASTQAEILRLKAALVDIELDIHLASGIAGYDLKPALAKIRALMVEELPARSLDGEGGA